MTEKTEFADISILPRTLGQTGTETERERVKHCRDAPAYADNAQHTTGRARQR